MSPEFRLRPSLSGVRLGGDGGAPEGVSPEFRLRPSLSVRRRRHDEAIRGGVAGVQTPAFVERLPSDANRWGRFGRVAGVQTPAFVERSSRARGTKFARGRVAGVQTPAFVERSAIGVITYPVSLVSPEFRLRPSLSAEAGGDGRDPEARVAGVQTPAFVERAPSPDRRTRTTRVAGV